MYYGADDALHAVDLLTEEDGHGQEGTHAVEHVFDLVLDVVFGHLGQHVFGQTVDHRFPALAASTGAALFRLDAQDRVQDRLGSDFHKFIPFYSEIS